MQKIAPKLFAILLISFCAITLATNEPQKQKKKLVTSKNKVQIKKLKNGNILLGKLTLNPKTKEITLPATINLDSGVLEVILATPKGRLHESLLKTDAQPLHLQTLLYLINANNGSRQKNKKQKQGDLFDIQIEWKDKTGKKNREPIESLIKNTKTEKNMKQTGWVFVGSSIKNGEFLANLEGNLVICYSAGFQTVLDISIKNADDDTIYVVTTKKHRPKINQQVTIIITPKAPKQCKHSK